MTTSGSCPPPIELEQFLLGLADDNRAVAMEAHLEQCPMCQQQLCHVGAEDDLVRALRSVGHNTNLGEDQRLADVSPALIELLVPHFQRIAADSDTAKAGGPVTDATVTFDAATLHSGSSSSSSASARQLPDKLGRYEIRGVLGRGGMGEVLHGYDPILLRSVAIKVVQADIFDDEAATEQLVREAQSAAAVEHDHIVPIFAVEVRHGHACIVMPLLKGLSLSARLEQTPGPITLLEILRIGRETAEGLAAAHARGLIHCDIKPANLWLEAPRDRVRILDFGLAIAHHEGSRERGGISGTPGYLAPEQAQGLPLDSRTDVFSLGCVLYRMATGRAPFTGDNRFKALWTVLAEPPVAASELNPEIPFPLSDLISRMMSRHPDARPSSAQEVVATLESIVRELAAERTRVLRRRWFAALLGVALLSGGGVGLWAFLAAPRQAPPVPMTFRGGPEPLAIRLRRDGQEIPVTLADENVVRLHPGEYSVDLVTDQPGRELLPRTFVVEDERPRVIKLVLAGEVAHHSMHTRAVTGVVVQAVKASASKKNTLDVWSVGLDRSLVAWDGTTSSLPLTTNLPHEARCLAASPDGQRIATAGGNKQVPAELGIRLWNAETLTEHLPPLTGHSRLVLAMAFSPDNSWLASAGAEGVLLWNLATGDFESMPESEQQTVHALDFSTDGRQLLSAGVDGTVSVWDLQARTLLRSYVVSEATLRAVAFVSTGYLVASDDGHLREWSVDDPSLRSIVIRPLPVTALAVSPSGEQLVWGDAAGTIGVWSRKRHQQTGEFHRHRGAVHGLAITSDGQQAVSAGADGTVRLWQLPSP